MEKRAREIVDKLTLEEKIGMIHGAKLFETKEVERLKIPALVMSDGPMGVRQEFQDGSWIPAGGTDDYVTYLPCNSALASTWNRELAFDFGSVLGEEARGRGKDMILGPGVNIKRSPLCGRNFEYFSEDPYLTKELAVPYIKGVQNWDVAACIKHFAVNNQETERLWVDVEIDEQALREIYLPAFYDAVKKANVYAVMGAYNKLYKEHCCESEFLLNKILRKEWGFDGVVVSDWGGVHDTKKAANSQLDLEMSVTFDFDDYCMANPLKEKILAGEIDEKVVDEKVVHILMLMMKLHMLDEMLDEELDKEGIRIDEKLIDKDGIKDRERVEVRQRIEEKEIRKSGAYNTPEHRRKALDIARESIVLLKNEKNQLPLEKEHLKRILLIGENANKLHANQGGSAEIKALYEISPIMGLKSQLGGNVQIDYVQGYCGEEKKEESDVNWQEDSLKDGGGQRHEEKLDDELIKKRNFLRKEAVSMASQYDKYDAVIYIGGLSHEQDSEGNDRADMKLPYEQDRLITELLDVREDMIVVLIGGSSVEIGEWIDRANTVLWSWYAGMEGGNALAEVLLGKINPSGKLPETFYKKLEDCSAHAVGEFGEKKTVKYKEGRYVGYRYQEKYKIEPEFCFGHGLSYTKFEIEVEKFDSERGEVSCLVKNTGKMDGSEVVQLYKIRREEDGLDYPELKGFGKIFLKSGEQGKLVIKLDDLGEDAKDYEVGDSLKNRRAIG